MYPRPPYHCTGANAEAVRPSPRESSTLQNPISLIPIQEAPLN
jgi:hypothetical protein